MSESADLVRLRQEYSNREKRLDNIGRYSIFNPAYLFMLHSRERAVLSMLKRHQFTSLSDYRILEVGCGIGGVLQEFWHGALPRRIFMELICCMTD